MQDIEFEDYQKHIETSLNIGRSFQSSPKLAMELISSPRGILEEIFPLSPIIFEESDISQLWNEIPEKTTYEFLQPEIKSSSFTSVRSQNGLKTLSWKVKEIVESLGSANYKSIADELIINLDLPNTPQVINDEKNIRRRVYDALNVLVAANVIQKQGKRVVPGRLSKIEAFENDALKNKREQLKALVRKYVALKNLFERNSMQNKTSQALPFPLMVVPVPKQSNYEITMNKKMKATVAVINSSKFLRVINEASLITMMGLHKKMYLIPYELKSLCGRF